MTSFPTARTVSTPPARIVRKSGMSSQLRTTAVANTIRVGEPDPNRGSSNPYEVGEFGQGADIMNAPPPTTTDDRIFSEDSMIDLSKDPQDLLGGRSAGRIPDGCRPLRGYLINPRAVGGPGGRVNAVQFFVHQEDISDSVQGQWSDRFEGSFAQWMGNFSDGKISAGKQKVIWKKYAGVASKQIEVPITWIADRGFSEADVIRNISYLQSLCYPAKIDEGLMPPVCVFKLANLYTVNVLVIAVKVSFTGPWQLRAGLPMMAKVMLTLEQFDFLNADEVLKGMTFNSYGTGARLIQVAGDGGEGF